MSLYRISFTLKVVNLICISRNTLFLLNRSKVLLSHLCPRQQMETRVNNVLLLLPDKFQMFKEWVGQVWNTAMILEQIHRRHDPLTCSYKKQTFLSLLYGTGIPQPPLQNRHPSASSTEQAPLSLLYSREKKRAYPCNYDAPIQANYLNYEEIMYDYNISYRHCVKIMELPSWQPCWICPHLMSCNSPGGISPPLPQRQSRMGN